MARDKTARSGGVQDLFANMPRTGQVWVHVKTGKMYRVEGSTFNSITDQIEVSYVPLYPCELERFNKQLIGHPKAWLSYSEDGEPRYRRVDEGDPKLPLSAGSK